MNSVWTVRLAPRLAAVIAIFMTLTLSLVPWPVLFEDVYGYPMIDRQVYLSQITHFQLRVDYREHWNGIDYFTGEFLWGQLLSFLARGLTLGAEKTLLILTTLNLFAISYASVRVAGLFGALGTVNPLVIDLCFSQVRLAFALIVIGAAWRSWQVGRVYTVALVIAASSIHFATTLLVAIALVSLLSMRGWSQGGNEHKARALSRCVTLVAAGLAISLLIGPFRAQVLERLGDRRVEYPDVASSTAYLLYWLGLMVSLIASIRSTSWSFSDSVALVVTSLVAGNVILGGYSSRFLVSAWPFLLGSIGRPSTISGVGIRAAFPAYVLLQWMYWFRVIR